VNLGVALVLLKAAEEQVDHPEANAHHLLTTSGRRGGVLAGVRSR
jgi:hypothetical protein